MDFDDAEYGFKEEDKDPIKVGHESSLPSFPGILNASGKGWLQQFFSPMSWSISWSPDTTSSVTLQ